MDGASFAPTIYTNPKYQHVRNPGVRPEEYLYHRMHEKQQNLQRLAAELEDDLQRQCNHFQPVINKKSKKLDSAKSQERLRIRSPTAAITKFNCGQGEENISNASNEFEEHISDPPQEHDLTSQVAQPVKGPRHLQLYNNALLQMMKKEQYKHLVDEECTFQPNMGRRQGDGMLSRYSSSAAI